MADTPARAPVSTNAMAAAAEELARTGARRNGTPCNTPAPGADTGSRSRWLSRGPWALTRNVTGARGSLSGSARPSP